MKRNHNFGIRFVTVFLLICMILTAFVACKTEGDSNETGTGAGTSAGTSGAGTTDVSDTDREVEDSLPDVDLDGYEYRILPVYGTGEPNTLVFAPEEEPDEVVGQATYRRNSLIEERFKCKITEGPVYTDYGQQQTYVLTMIKNGEDLYDLVYQHCIFGANNSVDGNFYNFYDFEWLDFEKPWWNQEMVEELTVADQMYVAPDLIGLDALKMAKVLFLNKDLFAEFKVDLPYESVLDGTWTMEKLLALTKDVYKDDGDGERGSEDIYGYVSHPAQSGWYTFFDVDIIFKDKVHTLTLTDNFAKINETFELVYKLYFENGGAFICSGKDPVTGVDQEKWQANMFAEGHGLMGFAQLHYATDLFNSTEINYGVIPFPKYSETQTEYRTFCSLGNLMCIPVSLPEEKLENSSIVLEALVAETYKTVAPAYFDIALKNKYFDGGDDAKTLDIINDGLVVSFAYIYDNWQGIGHSMGLLGRNPPSKDFASYYAGKAESAAARLQTLIDFFEANA